MPHPPGRDEGPSAHGEALSATKVDGPVPARARTVAQPRVAHQGAYGGGVDQARVKGMVLGRLFGDEERLRIGRYVILERIGQGGMGVVYAAYDEELDRKVAIKILSTDAADETATLRLKREAQA
ncbi:MAG: hypothetical protein KC636_05480, partial [Myxococcales bacterium]|nr:hypothetical protein [Myxococcales bacterium]